MGRHSAQSAPRGRAVLAAAGVLLVAVGVFTVTRAAASGAAEPAASNQQSSGSQQNSSSKQDSTSNLAAAAGVPGGQGAAEDLLSACVDRQQSAQAVVTAAQTGAGHWRAHVQGQSDIDAGIRTKLDVQTNTWAPTKAAGPADQAAFDTATGQYKGASGCTGLDSAAAVGEVKSKLDACATRQQTFDAYLVAATAVMQDWRTHLMQMAQHAAGQVDSNHALDNWMTGYRNAPANLDAFAKAEAALGSAPACSA